MLSNIETLAMRRGSIENKRDVAEMKMQRCKCGVPREDKIQNKYIRRTLKVEEELRKAQEDRLRWYSYVMRRNDNYKVFKQTKSIIADFITVNERN